MSSSSSSSMLPVQDLAAEMRGAAKGLPKSHRKSSTQHAGDDGANVWGWELGHSTGLKTRFTSLHHARDGGRTAEAACSTFKPCHPCLHRIQQHK
jgi:hypothetical protein